MRGHVAKKVTTKGTKKKLLWYPVVFLGFDEKGKRKYKWLPGHDTKGSAEKTLVEYLQQINSGTYVDPCRDPLSVYLTKWLEHKRAQVRIRTCEIYERTTRLHINPHIGRVPVSDLKPHHLRDLYANLAKQDPPLSNRYISQIHTLLHDALHTALQWELISRNVADAVNAPKPVRKKFTVWTLDEVRRFLNAPELKDHRFYIAFLLALTTGMRQGEILALRWSDINFDNGSLFVDRTLTWQEGKYTFNPPKSESGARLITLPEEVVVALRAHRLEQNKQRLVLGEAYHNNDLVVARINGNLVTQSFIRDKFTQLINNLDMPYIRFHDLRHTHASILLELGEELKVIQEQLGHATIGITADTYTHLSKALKIRPALRLSHALFTGDK